MEISDLLNPTVITGASIAAAGIIEGIIEAKDILYRLSDKGVIKDPYSAEYKLEQTMGWATAIAGFCVASSHLGPDNNLTPIELIGTILYVGAGVAIALGVYEASKVTVQKTIGYDYHY